jgi:hypothetical protein
LLQNFRRQRVVASNWRITLRSSALRLLFGSRRTRDIDDTKTALEDLSAIRNQHSVHSNAGMRPRAKWGEGNPMKRSEYLHEAARLRALISEATTARAKQHLEEQARENEKLANGRSERLNKGLKEAA